MQQFAGYLYVILAAAMWALIGPVAKLGLAEGMTPLELAFWRASMGAALFAIHAKRHNLVRVNRKDIPVFILFGLIGVALFFGSYQMAVQGAGAALASILLYTAPAWVALISRLFFHEPITRNKMLALIMAMCGAGLVCLSGNEIGSNVTTSGILFGLLSGFTYSLHYVFGKTYLKEYSSVTLYMWSLPIGALALLPWVSFSKLNSVSMVVISILGVVCTYCAYYAYCEGLKRLEATRVAVVANAEPVLAAILALWWWDERLSPSGYTGGVLVLIAVLIIVFDKADRHTSEATTPAAYESAP